MSNNATTVKEAPCTPKVKKKAVLLQHKKAYVIQGQNQAFPIGIYLLKVSNKSTTTKCKICSKVTIKTPERCNCFAVFVVTHV